MSYTDLGKATGLSNSAVHQRVKRLEQRGLITGYGATVNYAAIGVPLTAFVAVQPMDPSQPDDCPERVADLSEVEACWPIAGVESYMLKVRVATPEALEELLGRIRAVPGMNWAIPCAPAGLSASGSNWLSCQISRAKNASGNRQRAANTEIALHTSAV